jgi:hypothetical protein
MKTDKILRKWYKAKEKVKILEEKIQKYKTEISREMNRQECDKFSNGGYTVSRRRNTKTYINKESIPVNLWKEYSTQCSYDSFHLVKL